MANGKPGILNRVFPRIFPAKEQRSGGLLTNPSSLFPWLGGGSTKSGVSVDEESALRFAAVYACISKISTTLSTLPFKVIENNGSNRTPRPNHTVSKLISIAPNSEQTAVAFWELIIARANQYGCGYALIIREQGTPTELIPVPNSKVKVCDSEGKTLYKVNGMQDLVLASDMLVIPAFLGRSPITLHRETIAQGLAAAEYMQSFYGQGATTQGFLSTEATFKDEHTRQANESSLQGAITGLGQAHKPPLFGAGIKWNSISVTPADAQYIETNKFTAQEICMIYGVPPFIVGLDSNTTFNNTEQQQIRFVQDLVRPWCIRIEAEVNKKLIMSSELGTFTTKFNINGLMRGDMAARAAFIHQMLADGVMNINEARALEELNSIDGGDEHLVQVNQMPLSYMNAYGAKLSEKGETSNGK